MRVSELIKILQTMQDFPVKIEDEVCSKFTSDITEVTVEKNELTNSDEVVLWVYHSECDRRKI